MRRMMLDAYRAVAWLARGAWPSRPSEGKVASAALRRILWVRLDHIGDVVMSLPALAELRRACPEAQVDVLVRPAVAPLVLEQHLANRVLTYDTPRFSRFGSAGLFRTLTLIRRLRRCRYDAAFEMRGDDVGRLLIALSNIPIRIGPERIFYEQPGAPNLAFLLTHPLPLASPPMHAVEQNLLTLGVLGLPASSPGWSLQVPAARDEQVGGRLHQMGVRAGFVCLHASSNDSARNWRSAGFAAVARHLVTEHGVDVVLTGTRSDAALNAQIMREAGSIPGIFDASGSFSLPQLPALYRRARMLLSVDSGPVHLAAAVGTRVVTLIKAELAPLHYPYHQPEGVVLPPAGSGPQGIAVDPVIQAVDLVMRSQEMR